MLTKSVIVAVGLLVMVNRSFSLSCKPCNWNECGPSPNCTYGVTQAVCSCCYDECKKGPGETCGGLWGFSGRCGDGLECKVIHDIHSSGSYNINSGICVEQGQIDECKDTWPSTECITMHLYSSTNKLIEVPACNCEDVVAEGLCTDHIHRLDYQNLVNVCKLSCDLCVSIPEPIFTTPDTTITTPEATSTTPDAMVTTSDPCIPTPCGPNSECNEVHNRPKCTCLSGYVGNPPNCRPECVSDSDCPNSLACLRKMCRDPCPGVCGVSAECEVLIHNPICYCPSDLTGDPFIRCFKQPTSTTPDAMITTSDVCSDTWAGCVNYDWLTPDGRLTGASACSCSDVVRNEWCTNPYHSEDCKLSCGRCDDWKWTLEANACIIGENNMVLDGISLDDCKVSCKDQSEFACRSLEYHLHSQRCILSEATSNSSNYRQPCPYKGSWIYTEA